MLAFKLVHPPGKLAGVLTNPGEKRRQNYSPIQQDSRDENKLFCAVFLPELIRKKLAEGFGTLMASEDLSQNDQVLGTSSRGEQPWQFSLRSLFIFTAIVAALLSAAKVLGEVAFGVGLLALLIVVSILAYRQSSKIAGLLVWLLLIQLVGAALLAPGDGGVWLCTMQRLYFAVDVFLFARLYVFYQFARRPEPQLSLLMKVAIMTSPIWMAVVTTYLMETYHIFR